jgi:Ohr subfamily peroxiredoxin
MTNTPKEIRYTAHATAQGGRNGHSVSDDGKVDVRLSSPTELGGDGIGTNPEQLFAVGYAACFNGALALVAGKRGVDASQSRTRAHVGFGPEGRSFAITVDLESEIPGVDLETAQALVEAAHEVCPYSKATHGNVPVTVKAVEAL